jgi:hypothetical protein
VVGDIAAQDARCRSRSQRAPFLKAPRGISATARNPGLLGDVADPRGPSCVSWSSQSKYRSPGTAARALRRGPKRRLMLEVKLGRRTRWARIWASSKLATSDCVLDRCLEWHPKRKGLTVELCARLARRHSCVPPRSAAEGSNCGELFSICPPPLLPSRAALRADLTSQRRRLPQYKLLVCRYCDGRPRWFSHGVLMARSPRG